MKQVFPNHTYNNGQPYRTAAGQMAPRETFHQRGCPHPILSGRPTPEMFIQLAQREMKIRCYSSCTIKAYTSAITSFLRWMGVPPHRATIEHVRNYLETIVDGGATASWVGLNLAAIRTVFDKFCCRDITLGLESPRKSKRQPVVLSQMEIKLMLKSAPSLLDKLLIAIMYATGLRVSEVASLRWTDFDFERNTIRVRQGKGNADRSVMLPATFRETLKQLSTAAEFNQFVFPSRSLIRSKERHISSRSIQRTVAAIARLANISKHVTPHMFRHAFATHLLENGTDIRFIQKLLGHQRLETTVIYTKVAAIRTESVISPVDRLADNAPQPQQPGYSKTKPVGKIRIELDRTNQEQNAALVKVTVLASQPIQLPQFTVRQNAANWIEIQIPSIELWSSRLDCLPQEQKDRIQSPPFYELLRQQVTMRFLKLMESPPVPAS